MNSCGPGLYLEKKIKYTLNTCEWDKQSRAPREDLLPGLDQLGLLGKKGISPRFTGSTSKQVIAPARLGRSNQTHVASLDPANHPCSFGPCRAKAGSLPLHHSTTTAPQQSGSAPVHCNHPYSGCILIHYCPARAACCNRSRRLGAACSISLPILLRTRSSNSRHPDHSHDCIAPL